MTFVIREVGLLFFTRSTACLAGTKLGQGDFGRKIALIFPAESLGRMGMFLNRFNWPKLRPESTLVHDRDIERSKRLLSDLAEGTHAGQTHPRPNPFRLDKRTR